MATDSKGGHLRFAQCGSRPETASRISGSPKMLKHFGSPTARWRGRVRGPGPRFHAPASDLFVINEPDGGFMFDIITRQALWRSDLAQIIVEMDQSAQPDRRVYRRRARKPVPWWEE